MRTVMFLCLIASLHPPITSAASISTPPQVSIFDCLLELVRPPTPERQIEYNEQIIGSNQPVEAGFSLARLSIKQRLAQVSHNLDHAEPGWRDKDWTLAVMRDRQRLYSATGLKPFSWGEVAIMSKGLAIGKIDFNEDHPVSLF